MEEPTKRPKEPKVKRATKEEIAEEEEPKSGFSLSRFSPIIMPVVLALAISWLMISILAVSKGDYNNAVGGLSSRMTAIETSIDEVVTGQESMTASIATSIQSLEDKLASYAPSTIDQEQLNSLTAELNNLKAQVANLNIPTQENIIATINSKFAVYEAELDDIEYTLGELWTMMEEIEEEEEEEEALANEVRWYTQIYCTNYGEGTIEVDLAEVRISPTRIEEADDYSIVIPLLNHTTTTKDNVIISVVFAPQSGSRTTIDEDEIYLDSVYSPFTFWTMDVVERSDGTCRRIVFTSDKIRVPAGTGGGEGEPAFEPGSLDLRLEFTLVYK